LVRLTSWLSTRESNQDTPSTSGGGSRDVEQWQREDTNTGSSSTEQRDWRREPPSNERVPSGKGQWPSQDGRNNNPSEWYQPDTPHSHGTPRSRNTPPHSHGSQWRQDAWGQWQQEETPRSRGSQRHQDARDSNAAQRQQEEKTQAWEHDMGHRQAQDRQEDVHGRIAHERVQKQDQAGAKKEKRPNSLPKQVPKPRRPPVREPKQAGSLFGAWGWMKMCTSSCSLDEEHEQVKTARVEAIRHAAETVVEDNVFKGLNMHGIDEDNVSTDVPTAMATPPPATPVGPGGVPAIPTQGSARICAIARGAGVAARGTLHVAPVAAGLAIGHAAGAVIGLTYAVQTREQAASAGKALEEGIEAGCGVTPRTCQICGVYFKTKCPLEHPHAYFCEACRWQVWCVTRVQARYRGMKGRQAFARMKSQEEVVG